ncbi:MAG: NADH-quinone oxidoreductase subunit M [FCB group bacterium]|jgi:NADH-quinone oxidoreductase subunit M
MFQFLGLGPLTWITFLPILGMVVILLLPSGKDEMSKEKHLNYFRYTTVFITFLQLIIAIILFVKFDFNAMGINDPKSMQFVENHNWIDIAGLPLVGHLKIAYYIGIDGLSGPMVLLTAIVCFVASFASWSISKAAKGYFAMYLLLDAGMMGVFVALDFFLFYVFWELMLLPMYFLIGIWGGPRKEYAAIKFFLYTLFGSVFMLLVMIALYFAVGSFNMLDMMNPANFAKDSLLFGVGTTWRYIAFMALFVGFAIKVPSVPFHTWLPDAHVEAPTPISVILAGVLLKMGTYGMLRISWPIFPDAVKYFQTFIAWVAMISIVYGAMCALGQHKVGKRDFKKLIAYSSVSHMGYVLLGMASMTSAGMVGAVFQMFNHGTITAMLFMIVGVIYDRSHTRGLDDFGGLANKMPIYTGIMTVAFFGAIGLPGLSGFISEALVFIGGFKTFPVLTAISGLGIILGAAYMLWTLQKVFLGKVPDRWAGPWDPTHKKYKTDDINAVELIALVPLAVIIIYLGINPSYMLNMMTQSMNHLVDYVNVGWWHLGAGF